MIPVIIDGKKIAASVIENLVQEVAELTEQGIKPGLAVVLVGEDPASMVYVNTKVKTCAQLGIYSEKHVLPKESTTEDVLARVKKLNANPEIHGILVQSPPPRQVDEEAVIAAIDPRKDVDCFHPVNVGKMLIGKTDGFFPCTPYGIMELLKQSGIDPSGKHAIIIGRSNIVGKPMMALLMQKAQGANATVTMVHSRTPNIPELARQADILIAALGKPEFVTADMVKEGAVVIDVGINRVEDASNPRGYRLVGDVKFDEVAPKTSFITKVPGGVGPMTIAILMSNAVKACKMQNGI